MLALDRDHAERIEDGSDHRVAPELPLGGEACPARQEAEEDEDVEVALMVRREDERAAARQVLETPHLHAHAEHPGERARTGLRESPGERPVAGQAVQRDGHRPHPDQHAAEEVR